MKLLLLHGPNLNLLGERKPEIYGSETLGDLVAQVRAEAESLDHKLIDFQSNSEGALIDELHARRKEIAGVIVNAGAYTHTSIALRDAFEGIEKPFVEVHISDIHARESFRHSSYLSDLACAVVVGEGRAGYLRALRMLIEHLEKS